MSRDIRVQMWVRNGSPTRFVLLVNGVPVARQNTSGPAMQNGQWTVMLDERMGPDFKPPKYEDHPKESQ